MHHTISRELAQLMAQGHDIASSLRRIVHEMPLASPLPVFLLQDGRQLQHNLTSTRAALKQADVRIAILEERNITLQQVTRTARQSANSVVIDSQLFTAFKG